MDLHYSLSLLLLPLLATACSAAACSACDYGGGCPLRSVNQANPDPSFFPSFPALRVRTRALERYHMIGNHELYNFPREDLSHSGLFTAPAQRDASTTYLSFTHPSAPTLRLVILDPFEISVNGVGKGDASYNAAMEIMKVHNPNDLETTVSGCDGVGVNKGRICACRVGADTLVVDGGEC